MDDSPPSTPKPPAAGSPELHGLDLGELLARGMQTVHPSGGAGAWEPPTVEDVGKLLPQYRVERLIGRGGMGAVYQGVQLNLDRPVAIKLLPAEMAADTQFVARFEREARTLAKLQHPRIVTIYDFGRTAEGHLFFAMEYIDGTDLRSILRGPGLAPDQALAVVGQLCDALQAAHRDGIVHRDLKPENVLVTRDGCVKLADFGLARPTQEAGTPNLTATDLVLGTPEYMAPEQRSGTTKADARSDIFALGVMLYEMLTGQTPRGVFDPPSHKVQVDVRIDEVVLKALQSEPERRYQQASELKTAVDHIRTTPCPEAATPPPPGTPAGKNINVAWLAGSAAALLLVAAAVLIRPGAKRGFQPLAPVTPGWAVNIPAAPIPEARKAGRSKKHSGSHPLEANSSLNSSLHGPIPDEARVVAAPASTNSTPATLGQVLVANQWTWTRGDEHGGTSHANVTFHRDGSASNTANLSRWFWWVVDARTVHVQFRPVEGSPPALNLKLGTDLNFNADLTSFRGVDIRDPGSPIVAGERKAPTGEFISDSAIPIVRVDPATAVARRNFAANLYEVLVGYPWEWATVGDTQPPILVSFKPDGRVSGGWKWHIGYKSDGQAFIDCAWGESLPQHEYLIFAPSLDTFDAYDMMGKCVVKGRRMGANGQGATVAATPAVSTPPTKPPPAVSSTPANASPSPKPSPAAPTSPGNTSPSPEPSSAGPAAPKAA